MSMYLFLNLKFLFLLYHQQMLVKIRLSLERNRIFCLRFSLKLSIVNSFEGIFYRFLMGRCLQPEKYCLKNRQQDLLFLYRVDGCMKQSRTNSNFPYLAKVTGRAMRIQQGSSGWCHEDWRRTPTSRGNQRVRWLRIQLRVISAYIFMMIFLGYNQKRFYVFFSFSRTKQYKQNQTIQSKRRQYNTRKRLDPLRLF